MHQCMCFTLPQVKAFDAHVSSGGGAVTGALTGVDVRVASGGGAVQLKSLVGKRAAVDSGGGPLTLGACYADRLDLDSGGWVGGCGWDVRRGGAAPCMLTLWQLWCHAVQLRKAGSAWLLGAPR